EQFHSFGDSEFLTLMRIVRTHLKRFSAGNDLPLKHLQEAADFHLKELDALKKEIVALRSLFNSSRDILSCYDELEMSITRFSLKSQEELLSEDTMRSMGETIPEDAFKLNPDHILAVCCRLEADLHHHEGEVERNKSQHRYLKNLKQEELSKKKKMCQISSQTHIEGKEGEEGVAVSTGSTICPPSSIEGKGGEEGVAVSTGSTICPPSPSVSSEEN
ncbi:hypothetical protein IE077_003406, partial [Cardiosporidium cionae]